WIHRLVQDPKRLFHRYVVVGLPFGASLMSHAAMRGMSRKFGRRRPLPGSDFAAPANVTFTAPAISEDAASLAAEAIRLPPARARRRPAEATGHTGSLNRLRAMVLLGGSVRSSPLSDACGRSLLDLPLDSEGSIFNHWLAHAADVARHAGIEKLP